MKKLISIAAGLLLLLSVGGVKAQSLGFSYFFPTDGYFSNPIAPVHFSLPVAFGNYFQISPGISMNSIGGMSMTGLDEGLNSSRPLVGPFQTFNGSLVPTIVIPTKNVQLDLEGGVFGFVSMNTKLMEGSFDAMYEETYNLYAAKSDITYDKDMFGWGYVFGVKMSFRLQDNIWGFVGAKYYMGSQDMPLNGSVYTGDNSMLPVDMPDASLQYHGFEITLGGAMRKKK
ncbi:MAG: hypothetical protein ACQES0_09900 [Bacteroidota bacterium]